MTFKKYYLSTAYRFTNSRFEKHITPERVERITEISTSDRILSPDQIRGKKANVDVEFEMFYSSSKFDEAWTHRQIAVAEYLDALSQLSARLDTSQDLRQYVKVKMLRVAEIFYPMLMLKQACIFYLQINKYRTKAIALS
jgi:hypothetical protein